jgi:hypothetical protein
MKLMQLIELKAKITEGKEKILSKEPKVKPVKPTLEIKNKDVQIRIQEDVKEGNVHKQNIVQKAQLYDELSMTYLSGTNKAPTELGKRFLVDFEPQYHGRDKKSQINAKYQKQEDERVKWEATTKRRIIDQTLDEILTKVKPTVKQGYENTLSKTEKECLSDVIQENTVIASAHDLARQKREEMKLRREQILSKRKPIPQ